MRVNGVVVRELGTRADPARDRVEVDGAKLVRESPVYVLLHKPRGVVSTVSDPEGRPCVGDMLGTLGVRAYPVGRLDFATSGALLATNDGDFANGLLHPRGGVPKTYVCKVSGKMEPADIERWRRGVELEDGKTLPAEVTLLRYEEGSPRDRGDAESAGEPRRGDARPKTWIELSIREGRNQQIRRMGEATGFPVMRLARTSFAGVTTEGLPPGRWRYLTRPELVELKKAYGVPKRIPHQLPQGGGEGMTVRSERGERRRGGFARTEGEGGGGGARYGFGAPGRRPAEVDEDYGGGIQRGASGERDPAHARQDQRRGRGDAPMRTTGTGGGIGAGGGSYAKPRRPRPRR